MTSTGRRHSPTDPAALASPSSAGAALLSAAAATLIAALVVAGAAGVVLVLTGRDRVSTSTGLAALPALGAFACATVAALLVLNRGLHPAAAIAVWVVAAAWPLGGLWLAIPAVLVTAAIAHASGGHDFYGPPAIASALAALVLLAAAAAVAPLHDNPRPASERGQTPSHNPRPASQKPNSERGLTPSLTRKRDSERGQTPSRTSKPDSEGGLAVSRDSDEGLTPSLTPEGTSEGDLTPSRTSDGGVTTPRTSDGGLTPSLTPAAAVVAAYYADLDARRFEAAWGRLGPAVRRKFGGFALWRKGFATTIESRPEAVTVAGPVVRLVLVARDRCPGGELTRRFAVLWRLERTPQDGWRAAAVTAAAIDAGTGCVSP